MSYFHLLDFCNLHVQSQTRKFLLRWNICAEKSRGTKESSNEETETALTRKKNPNGSNEVQDVTGEEGRYIEVGYLKNPKTLL